jgi:alkaline phosphatase D
VTKRRVFRHGVAAGDPLADRAIIWTRATAEADEPVDVEWIVARDPELNEVIGRGRAQAISDNDHTIKVDIDGLEPRTVYYYAFDANGERSPVGRLKTLPDGTADRLRLAFCSCAKYSAGYFNAYARIAEREDLDFVLHLGDYIYEYGNIDKNCPPGPKIKRGMQPPHECKSLADYRRRYAHYRRDPDVLRLHERHAIIATLDDHEICDNTWRGGAKAHDPDQDGDWDRRKAAALRAWHEWMPVRSPDPEDPARIYRSFRFGDLVDLFLLDGRTHRDEMAKPPEADNPNRTLLGRDQYIWLTGNLERSTATWRVVGNGVMMGQVYTGVMPDEIADPLSEISVITPREHGPAPDQWDGYPAERDRLLVHLRERCVDDLVFVSGDVHSSWAVDLKRRDDREDADPIAVEFVTPSLTSENLDEHMHADARTDSLDIERRIIEENPHIHWVELDSHGYVVLDVTSDRVRASWYFVDEIFRPSDGETFAESWEVGRGERRIRPVRHR